MGDCIHIKRLLENEENYEINKEFGGLQNSNLYYKKFELSFIKTFRFIQKYVQGWKARVLNTKKIAIPRCGICHSVDCSLINLYICMCCGGCFCSKNNHIRQHYEMNSNHFLALDINVNEVYCFLCNKYVYHEKISHVILETKIEIAENRIRLSRNFPNRVKFKIWRPNQEERSIIKRHANASNVPPRILGLRGLNNLGNTCFMNVILQTLSHSFLSSYFLADKHNNRFCYLSKISQFCLCCELDFLIDNMYNSNHSFFSPHNFLYATWRTSDHLAGYVQQDAHDFFITSLNNLHTHFIQSKHFEHLIECNAIKDQQNFSSNPSCEINISEPGNKKFSCYLNLEAMKNQNINKLQSISDLESWTYFSHNNNNNFDKSQLKKFDVESKKNFNVKSAFNGSFSFCDCPAHQFFDGTLRSDVKCFVCNFVSSSYESFLDISLELLPNNLTNLQECIKNFTKPEFVDHYYCESCNQKVRSIKQLSFFLLPLTFCFHIKRFKQTANGTIKINKYVKFPLHLDMAPYLDVSIQNNNPMNKEFVNDVGEGFEFCDNNVDDFVAFSDLNKKFYSLFSVVDHSGTIDNGHYICYIKHLDAWFKCDDHIITQVSVSEILLSKAYLLFYMKSKLEYINPG